MYAESIMCVVLKRKLWQKIVKLWLADVSILWQNSVSSIGGIKHETPNKSNSKKFLYKLDDKLFNDLPNTISFLRVIIVAVNKKYLKNVPDALHDQP